MQSYSLSELSSLIEHSINYYIPQNVWVRAEISSMTVRGGHCYMDLIEKAENDNTILAAKMRAVCWRDNFAIISVFFEQTTHQQLRAGMQVLLEVSCTYHAVYGLSLRVESIDPSYTLGDLQKQKDLTIEKLKKDGVFQMQQLLELPILLQRIAVVSAPDAAGYGDFKHQIEQNKYRLKFSLKLFPAIMQGDRADQSIISALEKVYLEQKSFDVVVIIRGGGATTDFSCFDSYNLASVCAQMPLPLLSGIGHQRDISVVDMVAFKSLKTPTAVAEFLINHQAEHLQYLLQLQQRLLNSASLRTERANHRLDNLRIRLESTQKRYIYAQTEKINLSERLLLQLSPEKIYKKGYSLTLKDGKILKSTSQLSKGDIITTELIDGRVISKVE